MFVSFHSIWIEQRLICIYSSFTLLSIISVARKSRIGIHAIKISNDHFMMRSTWIPRYSTWMPICRFISATSEWDRCVQCDAMPVVFVSTLRPHIHRERQCVLHAFRNENHHDICCYYNFFGLGVESIWKKKKTTAATKWFEWSGINYRVSHKLCVRCENRQPAKGNNDFIASKNLLSAKLAGWLCRSVDNIVFHINFQPKIFLVVPM